MFCEALSTRLRSQPLENLGRLAVALRRCRHHDQRNPETGVRHPLHALSNELIRLFSAPIVHQELTIGHRDPRVEGVHAVDHLEHLLPQVQKSDKNEQLAFWINAYNACTVRLICDHMPISSIKDISRPWKKVVMTAADRSYTLDDIEHRILRPIWKDPRIHYALNCAALGCPNLWAVAVTVENTEEYLNFGATAFINHPRGSRAENGRAVVSSIYKWFSEDFGGSDETLMTHLKTYASPELAAQLDGATTVSYDSYDWTLNSVAVPSIKAFSTGNSRGS